MVAQSVKELLRDPRKEGYGLQQEDMDIDQMVFDHDEDEEAQEMKEHELKEPDSLLWLI